MLKIFRYMIPAAVFAAGLWMSVTPSQAKPAYAKKEGKSCTYCHVTAGKPDLNNAGKYYAAHGHSLEGYTPAKQ